MALLNQPTQISGQLGKLFEAMREGQAPPTFNREFLGDLGFKSSNFFAVIPLLKGLGFLSAEGKPTSQYMEFLDETRWREVLGAAIREAYGDIFIMKARPTQADKKKIAGKFKSTYNLSDVVADRNAATFLALLELAGENAFQVRSEETERAAVVEELQKATPDSVEREPPMRLPVEKEAPPIVTPPSAPLGLHYNIQIHLPPTKDIEIYNAIFKAIRSHLID
jgi:hypothetical protein